MHFVSNKSNRAGLKCICLILQMVWGWIWSISGEGYIFWWKDETWDLGQQHGWTLLLYVDCYFTSINLMGDLLTKDLSSTEHNVPKPCQLPDKQLKREGRRVTVTVVRSWVWVGHNYWSDKPVLMAFPPDSSAPDGQIKSKTRSRWEDLQSLESTMITWVVWIMSCTELRNEPCDCSLLYCCHLKFLDPVCQHNALSPNKSSSWTIDCLKGK